MLKFWHWAILGEAHLLFQNGQRLYMNYWQIVMAQKNMGKNGRQIVRQHFAVDAIAPQLVDCFRQVAGHSKL